MSNQCVCVCVCARAGACVCVFVCTRVCVLKVQERWCTYKMREAMQSKAHLGQLSFVLLLERFGMDLFTSAHGNLRVVQ